TEQGTDIGIGVAQSDIVAAGKCRGDLNRASYTGEAVLSGSQCYRKIGEGMDQFLDLLGFIELGGPVMQHFQDPISQGGGAKDAAVEQNPIGPILPRALFGFEVGLQEISEVTCDRWVL